MTPRLRMRVDVVTGVPSMRSEKSWVERVRESGPMIIISDLSQLSLRKFCCIQDFMSVRQVERVEWVAAVMVEVERYSCVSSA